MKSYTIHLIRHGLTRGNEEGRYIGSTDLPLSADGERHLKALRAKGPYPQAQAYFTSPLKRCTQTLNIFYPGAKPIVIDDFRECDFGEWEGKTAQEIAAGDPRFARWIAGGAVSAQQSRAVRQSESSKPGRAREFGEAPGIVSPPGGENGGAFAQRVCAAFEKVVEGLMRSGVTSAVIVTHGGAIMTILAAYGLPKAKFYDWMTECGHGYSMRITPGLWMRSMVGEVVSKIPDAGRPQDESARGVMLMDLAREAAERAFGDRDGEKKS